MALKRDTTKHKTDVCFDCESDEVIIHTDGSQECLDCGEVFTGDMYSNEPRSGGRRYVHDSSGRKRYVIDDCEEDYVEEDYASHPLSHYRGSGRPMTRSDFGCLFTVIAVVFVLFWLYIVILATC